MGGSYKEEGVFISAGRRYQAADTSARRSLAQPRHLDELAARHRPGDDDMRVSCDRLQPIADSLLKLMH